VRPKSAGSIWTNVECHLGATAAPLRSPGVHTLPSMFRTSCARIVRGTLLAGLFAAIVILPGCYERTVSATGFGADRVVLHDPNSPDPVKTTKVRQTTTHKQLPARRLRVQER
jgi:hypothetical protein